MKVLVLADRGARTEALAAALEQAGHRAIVVGGRNVLPVALRAARPDALVVVSSDPVEAGRWLSTQPGAEGLLVRSVASGSDQTAMAALVLGLSESMDSVMDAWVVDAPCDASGSALQTFPERELILAKLTDVRERSYFSILEVHPETSPAAIRSRHRALVEAFSIERFRGRVGETFEEYLREVVRGLDDAWYVLGDERLRNQYTAALADVLQTEDGR